MTKISRTLPLDPALLAHAYLDNELDPANALASATAEVMMPHLTRP